VGLRKGDGCLQGALFREPVRAAELHPTTAAANQFEQGAKGGQGLDRGQRRLEGRRRGEGKLVEGPVDVGMTVAVPTNSMLAGQECDVLRAKRCFCSFDGFEKIGDRLWPNVRKDRERLAEQIAQHDRPNT
jgi:hypothetical protein